MKKINYLLTVATVILSTALFSCSKSNDALIEEYQQVCTDINTALKNGEMTKVATLAEKGEKIGKELDERELTDEQKAKVLEITADLMEQSTSSVMNSAQQSAEELEELFDTND